MMMILSNLRTSFWYNGVDKNSKKVMELTGSVDSVMELEQNEAKNTKDEVGYGERIKAGNIFFYICIFVD